MATNLAIDDNLIQTAKKIGGQRTKKAFVTEALEEYIQRRKQLQILKLAGKIDYDQEYDYKSLGKRSVLSVKFLVLSEGILSISISNQTRSTA